MMNKQTLLIENALIINEGQERHGSILIKDGRIERVTYGDSLSSSENIQIDRRIDATGLLCLPGIIDDQVHFRDPGLTHKGDIETESRAALFGGVTSYMEMPNTNPQTITMEAWRNKMDRAKAVSYANYSFFMGATNDNVEVLKEIDHTHTPGVKVFMGSSTGNMLVDNEATLRRIFGEVDTIIAIHSESEEVIRANKEAIIAKYGEDPSVEHHPEIRDVEACYRSTLKAVRLAKETGARLHVLHLSTAKELELFDEPFEPLEKKQITAEVCVHHLWFTDADYAKYGARIKWNPAVKSATDRDALREALRNHHSLDVIATDHAPHLPSEKEGGALKAASGGPLVQHSLVMMLALADEGVLTRTDVVNYMCHRPARLFGVVDRGFIREGYYADLVLVRQDAPFMVTQETLQYKCGWSPLEGATFNHQVHTTILNGVVAMENGKVNDNDRSAMPLEFNRQR